MEEKSFVFRKGFRNHSPRKLTFRENVSGIFSQKKVAIPWNNIRPEIITTYHSGTQKNETLVP